MRHSTCILLAGAALSACGKPPSSALQVVRDTIGDTIVVRTVAGSVWGTTATLVPEVRIGVVQGEDHYMFGRVRSLAVAPDGSIYVMDAQVPALRKYAPDGTYLATFGQEGSGPGEYRRPDGGLVALDDGRVVLRDPQNARLQVYSPTGRSLDTWPIRGGFNSSNNMVVDTAGRILTHVLLDPEAAVNDWRMGLVAYDPDTGEPGDTVAAPTWDFEAPWLVAQHASENGRTNTTMDYVPFGPEEHWAFSPLGYMVGGVSTRYAIDEYRPDGTVLRIERECDPVPVAAGERANREALARWNMRQTQPDWTWNGPAIPEHKPPFRGIHVGRDGRIWVQVSVPGQPIPRDQVGAPDADGPNPRPPVRWREPLAYDVFEPDGTYLGRVETDVELAPYWNHPLFDGLHVWAVVKDDMDVQYVARFRVAFTETEDPT